MRRLVPLVIAGLLLVTAAADMGCRSEGSDPAPAADVVPVPVIEQQRFTIRVRWPGASAEDVDRLVTEPMLRSLGGFEAIDEVEAVSRDGEALAIVTLSAAIRTSEIEQTRDGALRRISPRMPADAEIVALRGDPTAPPDQVVVLSSDQLSPDGLGALAARLRAKVEVLEGVDAVDLLGLPAREVRVQLDPRRLTAHGLDVSAVADAVRAPKEQPAGGAGKTGIEALGEVVVRVSEDTPVRLRDLATIALDRGPGGGMLHLDGRPAVGLAVHGDVALAKVDEAVRGELPAQVKLGWRGGEGARGLYVAIRLPGGSRHEQLAEVLRRVSRAARDLAGGDTTLAWTRGPSDATLLLRGSWKGDEETSAAAESLRQAIGELPGAEVRVTPLAEDGFSPRPAPVVVAVTGRQLDRVEAAAQDVRAALSKVAGLRSVWSSQTRRPEERVEIDRVEAKQAGVDPRALRDALAVRDAGLVVAQVAEGEATLPVRLVVAEQDRGSLTVPAAGGARLPLAEIVEVHLRSEPERIDRVRRDLRVTLSAEVAGRDLAEVRAEVEEALRGVKLPAETRARLE